MHHTIITKDRRKLYRKLDEMEEKWIEQQEKLIDEKFEERIEEQEKQEEKWYKLLDKCLENGGPVEMWKKVTTFLEGLKRTNKTKSQFCATKSSLGRKHGSSIVLIILLTKKHIINSKIQ